MSDFFKDSDVELGIKAHIALQKAKCLTKIGDVDAVLFWHGFIPQADVIRRFWPIFAPLFETDDLKYKDFKADVVYYTDYYNYSTEAPNINMVLGTGIKLEFITTHKLMMIEEQTQIAKKEYIDTDSLDNTKIIKD